ncbi:YeeE/YedE thiosulfate transporter family protein [Entomospira nematocerorum]|uniref:YeeE/YedE family protein n=1 Tax=Entomospira nematocerorum TaxID=2719987 RepID=A0A968GE06_9SPIO|nr:YeeE/YedE thiosulfate transporter family protein [Entomospira nematocera]NIZ46555.1 YeeE/YedE family protein [Entomospira nematocera]WDI33646.1 YeeE/YedE thiosulfate transporter family protein [Entomospira nematocera]
MNNFFKNLGKNEFYKKLLSEPLTYIAGAVLLSVFQIAHFAIFKSGWGVTSAFAIWGAWLYEAVGGDVSQWGYFSSESMQKTLKAGFFADGGSVRNLGIIFGALLSTLLASQFKIKKIKNLRQIIAAILGGLLMGYGARMANGCNIGALFTALGSWSLSGWVFAVFMLIGAYLGSKLLIRFFM